MPAKTTTKELDRRYSNGGEVALLWHPASNGVAVTVTDWSTRDEFAGEHDPEYARSMHALPTGELTLLFTDIESSTELADALGGGWEPVLEAHRDLIRTAATDAGGLEVECRADEMFFVFDRPADAVEAALSA